MLIRFKRLMRRYRNQKRERKLAEIKKAINAQLTRGKQVADELDRLFAMQKAEMDEQRIELTSDIYGQQAIGQPMDGFCRMGNMK